jgi:hypothetical protein
MAWPVELTSRNLLYFDISHGVFIFISRILWEVFEQIQWKLHPAWLEGVGCTHNEFEVLQLFNQYEWEKDQTWGGLL